MEYICPNCNKPIYDDEALLCLYCGESLGRPTKTTLGFIKSNKLKVLIFLFVIVIILSFLLMQF